MRKWVTKQLNKERAVAISQRYELPMLVAMLLDIRGITDDGAVIDFLSNETLTASPFEIKDMDKAAERVRRAIEDGERICVYGDFDADGVTSTALLYSYLSDIGADAIYYIPSRETEGYGMNKDAVTRIYERGVKLIITVDNGVAAVEEVTYANSLGIDTVITDHHALPEVLPDASAVVDLHRTDCDSSFKELSGVGVAFKLVQAIEGAYADVDSLLENYADLAAIGTVGDIVPLRGENRVLVKNGLRHINNGDRLGIAALAEEAGLSSKRITAGNLSFTLVPRINAGGRLGLSKKSVAMLLTDDEEYALDIAAELSADNAERQQIERDILSDIDEMIRQNPAIVNNRIIVVYGEGWHKGVIGIVASRIKEIYAKPAIIITLDGDGVCRASGRSVSGFSLIDAVFSCSELLIQCGGHPMAVGFGIVRENIDAFISAVNAYAKVHPVPVPSLEIDCKLNPAQLSVDLARGLSMLEPYGSGNPTPLFGLYNMTLREIREIGGGKHLRLTLSRGESTVHALRFSTTLAEFPYQKGDLVDLAVTLDINVYNNTENLSVFIRDMRFSGMDEEQLASKILFEAFCRGDRLSRAQAASLTPGRDEFAVVYRFLRANGGYGYPFDTLLYRLGAGISYGKLRVILECMNELGLIRIYEGVYEFEIKLCEVGAKVNLNDSLIIQKLKEVSAYE